MTNSFFFYIALRINRGTNLGVELVRSFKPVSILFSSSYYFLIALLLFSGINKILDPQPMLETIKSVINVSEELQIAASALLPVIEITLVIMLLFRTAVRVTLVATTFLFLFFFAFSIYGTIIVLENDCGCFGKTVGSSFGIGMIIRNLLFFSLSLFVLIKYENKSPGPGENKINNRR